MQNECYIKWNFNVSNEATEIGDFKNLTTALLEI